MIPIRNILVPTDFSEPAEAAWQYAQALATEFGSQVHVLHVVPEPYVYPWGTELSTMPLTDLLMQAEEGARERLTRLAPSTGALAGKVKIATAIGTPVEQILDYIADQKIDLFVMGTHGRGMVGHVLLGSVAERVVRRSPVPVLTLRGLPRTTNAAAAGAAKSAETH